MERTTRWLPGFWSLLAVGMFVGAGLLFATPAAASNSKVVICHIPPDDPGNAHTIVVSEKAVPAHLNHGDLLGECSTSVECDDNNACTIDTPVPGTQDCDYQPVDCDDGSACTWDWCDEIEGCQNDETCDTGDPCLVPFCNAQTGECDSAPVACGVGYVCDSETGDCVPEPSALCGDGMLDAGEQCDDGNNADGDGCASNCVSEFCGDGFINNNGAEDCDDGNNTNGDGCEGDCTLSPFCIEADADEDGYTPTMGDCNDADSDINPGATELCDGIDNNCDFRADLDVFPDLGLVCVVGDGVCEGNGVIQCDPEDPTETLCSAVPHTDDPNYSAEEQQCDGLDNDCDGLIDEDLWPMPTNDPCWEEECYAGAWRAVPTPDGTACEQVPGGSCSAGWCVPPPPDLDFDDDGFASIAFGGGDCDDTDPLVFPGAPELLDGKDNGCDSDGKVDEGLILAGDIVITEIHYDSQGTLDPDGEWFEVYNTIATPVNMRTWVVLDDGAAQESTVVLDDLVVAPDGFAVLCADANTAVNGGVVCDYEYGSFVLANTSDEVVLDFDGLAVDEVRYNENGGWPVAAGASLMLDPGFFDALSNDSPNNWCATPAGFEFGSGDRGTPGAPNPSCTP